MSRAPTAEPAQPGHDLRLRILRGDAHVFGPGRVALLKTIGTAGSISAAARALGMSYRRAWLLVESMNAHFREPLVTRRIGGPDGGGARVTEAGLTAIALYDKMVDDARRALDGHHDEWARLLSEGPTAD
jgi:molybdate transport system regulatory protein